MNTVPAAETVRVVTRRINESEGHVARVCGLFITCDRSICRAKTGPYVISLRPSDKQMTSKDLVGE
jgi:hypothetical protein